MEISASNFVELCNSAPNTLRSMEKTVRAVTDVDFDPKYRTSVIRVNYMAAEDRCQGMELNCHVSQIDSYAEQERIRVYLNKHKIRRAYLQYCTNNGQIFSQDKKVSPQDYMAKQAIEARVCPHDMQKVRIRDETFCLALPQAPMTKHQAQVYCHTKYGAKLFEPVNATRLHEVVQALSPIKGQNDYWLNGQYSTGQIPDVLPCAGHTGDVMNVFYRWNKDCVEFCRDFTRKIGSICIKSGTFRNLTIFNSELSSHLATDFKAHPGALSFLPITQEYVLEDISTPLSVVCTCKVDKYQEQMKEHYQNLLLQKTEAAISTIERSCKATNDPIENSPYIIYNGGHINKKKRSLPMLIMSAFRRVSSVLGGFARGTVRATGQIGRQVANAGAKAKQTFSKVKTFLPSLKKTAYLTTSASAIGVTALAIDQYLKKGSFTSVHGTNFSDEIKQAFHNIDYTATDQLHHSSTVLGLTLSNRNRIHSITRAISAITGSLMAVTRLNGISLAVDQIMINFNDKMTMVRDHFAAYNKIIDALTSKVFTDPHLTNTIVQASKQLPNDYAFMSENIFDLMKTASISHELEDELLIVNLFIPIVKQSLILYLFKGNPLPYQVEGGISVIPKYEAAYIAVSEDARKYALVRPQDLITCEYKNMYLCNSIPLFSREVKTCIYSHFTNNFLQAKDCHFYKLGDENHFQFTNDHILHYYVTTPIAAEIRCEEDGLFRPWRTFTINGTSQMKVRPGCQVEVGQQFISINPRMPTGPITRDMFASGVPQAEKFLKLPVDTSHLDEVHIPAEFHTAIAYVKDVPNAYSRFKDLLAAFAGLVIALVILYMCFVSNCTEICMDIVRRIRHKFCPERQIIVENHDISIPQPPQSSTSHLPNTTADSNSRNLLNLETSLSMLSDANPIHHSSLRRNPDNVSLPTYDQVTRGVRLNVTDPVLHSSHNVQGHTLDKNVTCPLRYRTSIKDSLYPFTSKANTGVKTVMTPAGQLSRASGGILAPLVLGTPEPSVPQPTVLPVPTSTPNPEPQPIQGDEIFAPLNCSGSHNCPHCIEDRAQQAMLCGSLPTQNGPTVITQTNILPPVATHSDTGSQTDQTPQDMESIFRQLENLEKCNLTPGKKTDKADDNDKA